MRYLANDFGKRDHCLYVEESKVLPQVYRNRNSVWIKSKQQVYNRLLESLGRTKIEIRKFIAASKGQISSSRADLGSREMDLESKIQEIRSMPHMRTSRRTSFFLLAAVSGSGKTRSIQRLLSRQYGHYFQACNVTSDSHGIHGPRRHSGTRDTLTLGKMIKYAQRCTPERLHSYFEKCIENWLRRLYINRRIVLAIFLEIADELQLNPRDRPNFWLRLQTHDDIDFFDETFQLSCLVGHGSEDLRHLDERSFHATQKLDTEMYFCLDEAQVDLDFLISLHPKRKSLLAVWTTISRSRSEHSAEPTFVYSGTSLKVDETSNTLVSSQTPWGYREIDYSRPAVIGDFPTLCNDTDFLTTMKRHGFGLNDQTSRWLTRERLELIIRFARPLYGRPGWSVRYIHRIKKFARDQRRSSDWAKNIEDISRAIQEEVRRDLKARLQKLRQNHYLVVLQDLARVTVTSDLMDQPTAFMERHGPTMISEAFALMRPQSDGSVRYHLQESLALEAAKEFFMDQALDLLEKALDRFMQENAGDMSRLGKAAEFFLAWVSKAASRERRRSQTDLFYRGSIKHSPVGARDCQAHPTTGEWTNYSRYSAQLLL